MADIIKFGSGNKITRINRERMPDANQYDPAQMLVIYREKEREEMVVCTLADFVFDNNLSALEHLFLCRKLRTLGFAIMGGGAGVLFRVQLAP